MLYNSRMFDREYDMLRMSLGDHIEELRSCLMRSLIGLFIALLLTFYFGFNIIEWLARPMLASLVAYGYPPQMYATDPTLGFTSVYLPVSLIAAAIVASPWIIIQLWRFIASGLYAHERRVAYILAPFSTIMTFLAIGFTYYLLLPICLMFFIRWSTYYPQVSDVQPNWVIAQTMGVASPDVDDMTLDEAPLQVPMLAKDPAMETIQPGMIWVNAEQQQLKVAVHGNIRSIQLMPQHLLSPLPNLGSFVKFAALMGLGVVVAFQLPVFMLVIGWTGLFDPAFFASFRKYAFFAAFIIGAILTPADLFSMFVLAVPLYALFEFGLLCMRLVYREPEYPAET